MTKEDNIIVPRWFLEVVENTLQIQHNINLDEKTEETCQDRNIRQSLSGVRKLLNGEELTGMERLEKLQPALPSNLDEAAEKYANRGISSNADPYEEIMSYQADKDALKAGAEWMAGQGVTVKGVQYGGNLGIPDVIPQDFYTDKPEEVMVQIRKK